MFTAVAISVSACAPTTEGESDSFRQKHIATGSGTGPRGKGVGDVNDDGQPDLLIGWHESGGLVWFRAPDWRAHAIATERNFGTDIEVTDLDGDGHSDVIAVHDDGILVYSSTSGFHHRVDGVRMHDIEIADLDGDGRKEIVARNQSAFGGDGTAIHVYWQREVADWDRQVLAGVDGEGLALLDMDRDGATDVVVNGTWLRNPGRRGASWTAHRFTERWTWPHVFIATGDVNGDGLADIALSPAERAGESYRMSWFESPREAEVNAIWHEHVIEDRIEAVRHFVAVGDVDRDGLADIVTAEMQQGRDPDEVLLYRNMGRGEKWDRQTISNNGSHSMRLTDIDGDGDLDLFGANWEGDSADLWINRVCDAGHGFQFERRVIDSNRPDTAIFVIPSDIDGDGNPDIVAGAWWYRNPGRIDGKWGRREIGATVGNVAVVKDLDGDGDADILATQGRGQETDSRFVLARNNGKGNFTIEDQMPRGAGDFLQGAVAGDLALGRRPGIALSWHQKGRGVELLTLPASGSGKWTIARIAEGSQDEQLSAGDIDRDGDSDLFLGTRWLRNDTGRWREFTISQTPDAPDRNRLVDMNGDGRLDAVVGFEAISRPGGVLWFEQREKPSDPWPAHQITTLIGPMSLDVADMDRDGDPDIVVGEHNLDKPQDAGLYIVENADAHGLVWYGHRIAKGDEHHDGAQVADMDGDGDLDIVSIGWSHGRVLVYENQSRRCDAARKPGSDNRSKRSKP